MVDIETQRYHVEGGLKNSLVLAGISKLRNLSYLYFPEMLGCCPHSRTCPFILHLAPPQWADAVAIPKSSLVNGHLINVFCRAAHRKEVKSDFFSLPN